MTDTILLTGGTGFLGTEIAAALVRESNAKIYALVRSGSEEEAVHRLKASWQHDETLYRAIGEQIVPLRGDFTLRGVLSRPEDGEVLRESVTMVVHAGAEVGFQKSRQELYRTNCLGTENMLGAARQMKNLRRFVHVSTAYVAGRRKGLIREDEPLPDAFSSHYEESKAQAETMVRRSGLPLTICRPGMIVGDSRTGWIRSFNTIYYVLKLLLQGRLPLLPISPDTPLNLVPGDYVAKAVLHAAMSEDAVGKTLHLICPKAAAPRAKELSDYVRRWAKEKLDLSLPPSGFMPLPALEAAGLRHNAGEGEKKKSLRDNLLTLLPYFFAEQEFDRSSADAVCGPYEVDWHTYIEPLLTFACRKNFMRQTGQTVFEQARVRRSSTRYPITYYDVSAKGIKRVTGQDVNSRIEKAYDALWVWGIRKGDRVALTGINSVDYLVLEQAIGLLGAVSVPIYYTTPAAEVSQLLERSGARWFFVGDRRMMEQLAGVHIDATLVSFSTGLSVEQPSAIPWERFLRQASGHAPAQYPDPEDLATIRYTSGTTGEPKGVTFNYAQLAWMGEILTNILTWEDRNRPLRYLSFLPLSHVVEGILASYAPYYLLSKVDYYYLNDFGSLTEALPRVRPTIFFSVPRFYEKVWEQLAATPIGKKWLDTRPGPAKQALGKVLRTAVLRRAGIDRCRQLIVGSAPVSETLLLRYRELGVEIYNAYGQTEAPLITINRVGDNVIPSIGTALPDTTVTVEPDGELIVTGPQVTLGYYGLPSENIRDGVLRTGDLGTVDVRGHITLFGRKKDFIVTAYGKNISVPKIEERLKDIPGVTEAVLICESRPYCTALLWMEGAADGLGAAIEKMNAGLSRPEQVRKFRVIPTPLSIQKGELTPNLKVKRANVEAHYAAEIEEMYR